MHKDFNNPKGGAELMRLNFKKLSAKIDAGKKPTLLILLKRFVSLNMKQE